MVTIEMYRQVRAAIARARTLFGDPDSGAVDPPVFAAPPDLEQQLGRGAF